MTPLTLQLLATIQLFLVQIIGVSSVTIHIDHCPRRWKIMNTCSAVQILSVRCNSLQSGTTKLFFKIPKRFCFLSNANISLQIKKSNGQTEVIDKICKCCNIFSTSSNSSCEPSSCKESLSLTLKPTDDPKVFITVEHSGCNLSETSETGTGLQLFGEKMSWIKALQFCHNFTSILVEITTQTVKEEVESLLKNKTEFQEGIWIGLERSIFGTNVDWKWTSGLTTEYHELTEMFSVDPLNNHCGKIIWKEESNQIMLHDANCHEILPFICQDPM